MSKEFKKGFHDDLHRLSVVLVKCDLGTLSFSYCVPILYRFLSRYLWCQDFDRIYKK